jgi:hypothetical protein
MCVFAEGLGVAVKVILADFGQFGILMYYNERMTKRDRESFGKHRQLALVFHSSRLNLNRQLENFIL